MDIDKVVKIRISVRPLRWLVNVIGGFMLLSMVACPAVTGNLPPPPVVRILSATEQAKLAQVAFIELEIMSRPGTAAGFPAKTVAAALVQEAHDVRLDPLFVLAVIEAESNFDVEACSPSKAKGLMQILPSTFASLNPTGSIFDPVENVRAGTRYLALLGTSFRRPESILMAYNGGPGRTSQYLKAQAIGEDYPISDEMRTYPGKVMSKYKRLLAKTGQKPANAHKLFRVTDAPVSMASIGKQP
jgi:soluble lytic murein transglycosylase-like protein